MTNGQVRVLILTTEGPVEVEAIRSLKEGFPQSLTWVSARSGETTEDDGTLSGLTDAYHKFVNWQTGIAGRFYHGNAFALVLSSEISAGQSWQLPVLLAHALKAGGRLAERKPNAGDNGTRTIVFATGQLRWPSALFVEWQAIGLESVEAVPRKLEQAFDTMKAYAGAGHRVVAIWPAANRSEVESWVSRLKGAGIEAVEAGSPKTVFRDLGIPDPIPILREHDPEPWRGVNPYPGMVSLREEDADYFFGRERLAATVLKKLIADGPDKVLALVGKSGVGKSSLAQAGILAPLKREVWPGGEEGWPLALNGCSRWRILKIRPGDRPLKALALAFTALIATETFRQDAEAEGWAQNFRDGARLDGLIGIVRRQLEARGAREAQPRFVLHIDPGEELYAHVSKNGRAHSAKRDAEAFSRLAAEAAARPDCRVIFCLRSDYYGELQADETLFPVTDCIDVPPMGAEALKRAIESPAAKLGVRFSPENLPSYLAEATAREAGALPLLAFLLADLWRDMEKRAKEHGESQKRSGSTVRFEPTLCFGDRPEVFEISTALRKRADKYLNENKACEVDLKRLFTLRLARVPRLGEPMKRLASKSECAPEEWRIAGELAGEDWRLVTLSTSPAGGESFAEVTHEQILQKWPVLAAWLDERRDFLIWKSELENARLDCDQAPAAEKTAALLTGRKLAIARQWIASHPADLATEDRAFVEASAAEANRRRDEEARREQTRREKEVARFAADTQRIEGHIETDNFKAAGEVLASVARYLNGHADPDLAARAVEVNTCLVRIRLLERFYAAAGEAATLAGEESFEAALAKCEEALRYLEIEKPGWLETLPSGDLTPRQIVDLEQEVYRTLLLYAALQLVPLIRALGSRPRMDTPVRNRQSPDFKPLALWLAGQVLRPPFGPLLLRAVHRLGRRLIEPVRRRNQALSWAGFNRLSETLTKVSQLETRLALQKGKNFEPSRTSQLVKSLAGILAELSAPPGSPIHLPQLLKGGWEGPPPEPVNTADYFFIGLLNYVLAKRKQSAVPRALVLLRRQFPDVDGAALAGRAEQLLNTAIWLEPGNYWAHWVLGQTLLVKKEFAAAQAAFNAAIALRPTCARGYEQRALAAAEQWKKSKEDHLRKSALRDSNRARHLAEGDPSVFWPRGKLFEKLGDFQQAFHFYARWLELEQNITSTISRATALHELERLTTHVLRWPPLSFAPRRVRAGALAVRAHIRLVRGVASGYGEVLVSALEDASLALYWDPQQEHALTAKGVLLHVLRKEPAAALAPLDQAVAIANSLAEPNYRALFERAKVLQALPAGKAALAAWQILREISEASAGDRCPAWMLKEARMQEAAILNGERDDQSRATTTSLNRCGA